MSEQQLEDDFDINEADLDLEGSADAGESLDDSVDAVMEELAADEADKELQGDQGKKERKPVDKEVSEAASRLSRSRKRKTREKDSLDLGGKQEEPAGEQGEEAEAVELEPIQPPARFPVDKKEWFLKQPREAQEEISKMIADQEAQSTKVWQDANREKARYEDVNKVINHYLPQWNLNGLTEGQVIRELCGVQDIFAKQGPIAGCLTILQKNGVTPEQLYQASQNGNAQPQAQPSQSPQNGGLTEEKLVQLLNQREAQTQQRQVVTQAEQEFRAAQNEMTPDGRYAYPELHDDNYIERAKPFVSDLRKTQPNIPWGEAFKRVVQQLRVFDGKYTGSPSAASSPKLPTNDIQRVKNASVSVRGRGNPAIPNSAIAKRGESLDDSIAAVFDELI